MNIILVGGPGDGRRVVVPNGQTRYEVVEHRHLLPAQAPALFEPVIYDKHLYSLFKLHPKTRVVVFAYEHLDPTQTLERLLEGYRPEENNVSKQSYEFTCSVCQNWVNGTLPEMLAHGWVDVSTHSKPNLWLCPVCLRGWVSAK